MSSDEYRELVLPATFLFRVFLYNTFYLIKGMSLINDSYISVWPP